jgi:hypothetical protein
MITSAEEFRKVVSIDAMSQKARRFEIYYDHNRGSYWAPNKRDGWVMISAADVRRWLKERGCNGAAPAKDKVSEIDALMNTFQREFDVEYVDRLPVITAGYMKLRGNVF